MDWSRTVKIIAVPALAATVLAGGYLLSGPPAAAQAASPAVTDEAAAGSPQLKGSIYLGQETNGTEKEQDNEQAEAAQLAVKAKIDAQAAQERALAAHPRSLVKKVELGNENGFLVYEVQLQDQSNQQLEVKVDAGNGQILATESDQEKQEDENQAEGKDFDQVEEEVEEED